MSTTYAQRQTTAQKVADSKAVSLFDSSSQSESLQRKADLTNNAAQRAVAPRPNNTGMPDNLKSGIESLSGFSMDDVRVHYNSSKPATVQALAYTQGTDIHVAPGQEKHLPHEAWHVAQQMAGRVSPTTNINGMPVNDNAALEHEADVMGEKAVQCKGNIHLKKQIAPKSSIQCTIKPDLKFKLSEKIASLGKEKINRIMTFLEGIEKPVLYKDLNPLAQKLLSNDSFEDCINQYYSITPVENPSNKNSTSPKETKTATSETQAPHTGGTTKTTAKQTPVVTKETKESKEPSVGTEGAETVTKEKSTSPKETKTAASETQVTPTEGTPVDAKETNVSPKKSSVGTKGAESVTKETPVAPGKTEIMECNSIKDIKKGYDKIRITKKLCHHNRASERTVPYNKNFYKILHFDPKKDDQYSRLSANVVDENVYEDSWRNNNPFTLNGKDLMHVCNKSNHLNGVCFSFLGDEQTSGPWHIELDLSELVFTKQDNPLRGSGEKVFFYKCGNIMIQCLVVEVDVICALSELEEYTTIVFDLPREGWPKNVGRDSMPLKAFWDIEKGMNEYQ